MEVSGQRNAPAAYPRGKTLHPLYRMWVGPRAGLDGSGKVASNGIRSPDRPARSESIFRPTSIINTTQNYRVSFSVI